MHPLDKYNQLPAIKDGVPFFETLTPEDQKKFVDAWYRKDRITLIQKFNYDSDSDLTDSNAHGDGSEKQTK